ncbi:Crp/Fnr family transcriptional regulator [Desulfonatronum thioautotrophicum]|uniref:Crp/Fnr family transcriptional regulator n=1 Tax=Desulfonatronum thioautotrophicum TaxID=617001 RepID=UPI0013792195|nr:cyclic nucleotide-binding domain-containing protein [Desulfonatronum thioautotrophicum]
MEVAGRVDILALDRIIAPQNTSSRIGGRVKDRLFGSSRRIFSKYAQSVSSGNVVYRKGDQGRDIYYLRSGRVLLFNESSTSSSKPLALIEPGQFFGETAYLLNQPRLSTARAETDSELILLSPSVFEDLLAHSPSVSRKIISSLGLRLKQATKVAETG